MPDLSTMDDAQKFCVINVGKQTHGGVVVRASDLRSLDQDREFVVRLPAGALPGYLGQLILPSLRCR